jgi:hypothetical protein
MGAPRSPKRTPDFLSNFLALANLMRLSLMKAAHTGVGGAPKGGSQAATARRQAVSFHNHLAWYQAQAMLAIPYGAILCRHSESNGGLHA